jgi:dipeptidyl aminopeptidase/acylaminoacyl peptidase
MQGKTCILKGNINHWTRAVGRTAPSPLYSRRCTTPFTVLIAKALLLGAGVQCGAEQELRSWRPEDSVAVRYFSGNSSFPESWPSPSDSDFVNPSPDGRYFFIVSHRGSVAHDSNIFDIAIFDSREILRALKKRSEGTSSGFRPSARAEFESFSSRDPGLKEAHWDHESRGVLFKGLSKDGLFQAFRLDPKSGTLTQLTSTTGRLSTFAYRDGVTVFRAASLLSSSTPPGYPIRTPERTPEGRWLLPFDSQSARMLTYVVTPSRGARLLEGDFYRWWIRPGGGSAIALANRRPTGGQDFVLVNFADNAVELLARTDGQSSASSVENTPRLSPDAIWSDDGQKVVLLNAHVRVEASGSEEQRLSALDMLVYDVTSRQISKVLVPAFQARSDGDQSSRLAVSVQWGSKASDTLLVRHHRGGPSTVLRFRESEGRWVLQSSSGVSTTRVPSLIGGLRIEVQEDQNTPPAVVARVGSKQLTLIPPDATWNDVWRAEVKTVRWKDSEGTEHVGGLMLPRGPQEDGSLPLVIQAHSYHPEFFLPDGIQPSGFAAQTLVAHGFAVFQLRVDMSSKTFVEGKEGGRNTSLIASAIRQLAEHHQIDPGRVGVVGFSRSGYHVLYAVTHPTSPLLGAAICVDSYDGSFASYLRDSVLAGPNSRVVAAYEHMPGGSFWTRKDRWLEHEPTFNADRVRTPTMFLGHGVDFEVDSYALQIVGAFQLNRKPVEYLTLPEATHLTLRPHERIAETNAVVDWMRFWLLGIKPADEDRARRWEQLKQEESRAPTSNATSTN